MPAEHWWNADFDLSLAGTPDDSPPASLRDRISEFELHGLLAADPGDSVLLRELPPDDFVRRLENSGIETAEVTALPSVRADRRFEPYGWNTAAVELSTKYDRPPLFPPFEVVRRVNGRSFGHRVEREFLNSDAPLGGFSSIEELRARLDTLPDREEGWVVKTEFGNAALGNRRLRNRRLTNGDRRWLDARLARGPVVLERWFRRYGDYCAVFRVTGEGKIENLSFHETIHTADGAFIGAIFDRGEPIPQEWIDPMVRAAAIVAREVTREGYFGPVCIDAMAFDDDGEKRLRPLVDLNARRHASEGWKRLAGIFGGCLYGRFFSTRKLRLPDLAEDFERALGSDRWNSSTGRGTLATSPLWLGGNDGRRRPHKLGIVFAADSRDEVLAMESRFRRIFER